jgi:hypothetical protein
MKYLKKFNENRSILDFKKMVDNLFIDLIDKGANILTQEPSAYCDIFNDRFIEPDIKILDSSSDKFHYILNRSIKDIDTGFNGIAVSISFPKSIKIDEEDIECIKFANDYFRRIGYEFKQMFYFKKGRNYYSIDENDLIGVESVSITYKLPKQIK